jgi:general secretion pathway protein J
MKAVRGFTLLEILIAMATFAIFSLLAYGALGRLFDTRDRLAGEREFWRTLALTFTQMEDDLSVARGRTVRDPYGNSLPALRGVSVDARGQGDAFLAFTRGGRLVAGDMPTSDLVRVGYRLEDKTLSRLTWSELDQAPQSKPVATPLLEGVTQIAVRYYSTSTKGWASTWPPEGQTKQLPSAVEITFTIEGRGQFQRLLRVNG